LNVFDFREVLLLQLILKLKLITLAIEGSKQRGFRIWGAAWELVLTVLRAEKVSMWFLPVAGLTVPLELLLLAFLFLSQPILGVSQFACSGFCSI
jgi:hypothetical protein